MDNKSHNSNNSSGNFSNSPRMSAEDKFKKSSKNLSYTSGSSIDLDRARASIYSSSRTSNSSIEDTSRKKVGGVVLDLETIQDATKQKLDNRGKGGRVAIVVLSVLLLLSLIYLAVAIIGFSSNKAEINCKYITRGTASAQWIVENNSKSQFRVPSGLSPETPVYEVVSVLRIKSTASVNLSLEIKATLNGEELLIWDLNDMHHNLIRVKNTNKFVYTTTITGGGDLRLFTAIDFTDASENLSSKGLEVEVIATVDFVA